MHSIATVDARVCLWVCMYGMFGCFCVPCTLYTVYLHAVVLNPVVSYAELLAIWLRNQVAAI